MKLTVITEKVNCKTVEVADFKEFCELITNPAKASNVDEMWSTAVYSTPRRNNANYAGTPAVFAIDIDSNLDIETAERRLASMGISYAIAPTRNHQKSKDGVVCDRFRVLIPLASPIGSVAQFQATWAWFADSMFPEMDVACKDPGRGYYYSDSLYKVVNDLASVAPQPEPTKAAKQFTTVRPAALGESKDLSKGTYKFLVNGAGKGGRDQAVFKAASDFKANGFEYEDALARILAAPIEYSGDFSIQAAEAKVHSVYFSRKTTYPVQGHSNDGFRTFVSNSFLLKDIEGEQNPILLNNATKTRVKTTTAVVAEALGKATYAEFCQTNIRFVQFGYNPTSKEILTTNAGEVLQYNQYEPPAWQADSYYHGSELPAAPTEPPPLVREFLLHLVDQDLESYQYVLDWLATSLRDRNLTVLTAIGEEGVGKGTLGEIMERLVGETNFSKVRSEIFKGRFNAQMQNKRIVFIDEVSMESVDEYNRFKDIVNDKVEIEAKGKDARSIKNFASYYVASNNANAIRVPPGDRRFSLVNLTKTKIMHSEIRHKIGTGAATLLAASTINPLALYLLLSHKIVNNMYQPFRSSAKTSEITEASLSDWEHYFIYEYLETRLGQKRRMTEIAQDIVLAGKLKMQPGRKKFENLAKRYPEFLKLYFHNRERYIEVLACPPTSNDAQYETILDTEAKPTNPLNWT